MQLSNIPGKLVLPFANAGGKSTIPVASQIGITAGAASLTDGFPPLTRTPIAAGGVPPSGLDMNGILYEMSAIIRWANAGGGYPFDGTFAADANVGGYPKGARIMRSDGTGYWFNTVENNVTDPEGVGAAAAGWVPDFTSGVATVAMASSSVTLTPAQYGKPIIIITGTLTANLNLIFPAIAGEWTVINNATGNFTITGKTAAGTGVPLGTVAPIVGDATNIYSMLGSFSAPSSSSLIGHLPDGTGAIPTTVANALNWNSINIFRFMTAAQIADVRSNAATLDMTTPFAVAMACLTVLGGGNLICPRGTYLLNGSAGADSYKNGILIPQVAGDFSTHKGIRIIGEGVDTVFKAGSTGMIVLRHSRLYSGGENFKIDGGGLANVIGLALVPESLTQTTTVVSQSYGIYKTVNIENCIEGLLLQPGPTVTGADSGAFYHSFYNLNFNLNTRHVWMKKDVTGAGNRTTRTAFYSPIFTRGNTGVQIDGGTEIDFYTPSFEIINTGVTPSATPTAFNYNDTNPANIRIFGGYGEACTKAVVSINPQQVQLLGFVHNSTPDASEALMLNISTANFNIPKIAKTFKGTTGDIIFSANGQNINFTGTTNNTIQNPAGAAQINYGDRQFWRSAAGVDVVRLDLIGTKSLFPTVDNSTSLGQSGFRWSAVWAANGVIQTSDPRTKTDVIDSPLGLEFINKLRPVAYKFKIGENKVIGETVIKPEILGEDGSVIENAIVEPIIEARPGKRQHFGLLTTQVKAALGKVDFGGYVKIDPSDPESEEGLRYEEFIAPLIKAVQELSAKVAALEAKGA